VIDSIGIQATGLQSDAAPPQDEDDVIMGTADDDTMDGTDGDDWMDGGGGGDLMHGGAGNDYIIGESFSFGDGWDDQLYGDAGDDLLEGLDGQDYLNGGDGDDVLDGYGGDDTFNGGAGADWFEQILSGYAAGSDVIEDFTDGADRLLLAIDGLTQPDFSAVESIVQDGADTVITYRDVGTVRLLGVDAATITVDDFIFWVDGDSSSDAITGASTNDLLSGNGGDDVLKGASGADQLEGGAGNDRMNGGGGADLLIGGMGHDTLKGGVGADIFRYETLHDKGDLIVDFNAVSGDQIDLSAIDANAALADDQAFVFVGKFDGHAGQATLSYDAGHDRTVLKVDIDGDRHGDFAFSIAGDVTADLGWVL
jgi:Ca2+-binding RTX toxin-like protein